MFFLDNGIHKTENNKKPSKSEGRTDKKQENALNWHKMTSVFKLIPTQLITHVMNFYRLLITELTVETDS